MFTLTKNGAKGHHKFTLDVTENSTSAVDNTSSLSFTFKISPISNGWDWYDWGSKISYVVNINGTKYTGTIPAYDGYATVTLKSGSLTVEHNSDGTKSISVSFSVTDGANQYYTCGNASASGTMELSTIPRASTISVTDGEIGSTINIVISKKVTDYIHTLTYAFGNLTGTIATKTSDSVVAFNLPTSFYSQIIEAKTGTGSIYCITYNSTGTQIGDTQSATFKALTTEEECKPNVSLSAVDTNTTTTALTGDSNKIIKYFSNVKVTLTATARNSATIKSTQITCGDGKSTTSTSTTFNNVENANFVGNVVDSRGYSNSITLNKTLINYIKLTCNATIHRPEPTTGEAHLKVNGNYFNQSFGAVTNTITLQYRYKESNSSTWSNWVTITATKNGNTYSYDKSLGTDFDYTKAYDFQINTYDKLMNLTVAKAITQGIPLFDWGENDFNFNVPVTGTSIDVDSMTLNGQNLINRIKGYGEIATQVFGDYNTMCGNKSGFYRTTTTQNAPYIHGGSDDSSNWAYIIHIAHSDTYQMQIVSPYFKEKLYYRNMMSGTWNEWVDITGKPQITPTVLYEDETGTNGTVTLSDSAENYEYLEIFYCDNTHSYYGNQKIYKANGKDTALSLTPYYNDGSAHYSYIYNGIISIDNTSISRIRSSYMQIRGTSVNSHNGNNYLYITRVLGHK